VSEVLTDCEYTCRIDNVAQGKTATQITGNLRLGPGAAVDGNLATPSCTETGMNRWWAVDLGAPYDVATVNVTTYVYMNSNAFSNYLASFIHSLNDRLPVQLSTE